MVVSDRRNAEVCKDYILHVCANLMLTMGIKRFVYTNLNNNEYYTSTKSGGSEKLFLSFH